MHSGGRELNEREFEIVRTTWEGVQAHAVPGYLTFTAIGPFPGTHAINFDELTARPLPLRRAYRSWQVFDH